MARARVELNFEKHSSRFGGVTAEAYLHHRQLGEDSLSVGNFNVGAWRAMSEGMIYNVEASKIPNHTSSSHIHECDLKKFKLGCLAKKSFEWTSV